MNRSAAVALVTSTCLLVLGTWLIYQPAAVILAGIIVGIGGVLAIDTDASKGPE